MSLNPFVSFKNCTVFCEENQILSLQLLKTAYLSTKNKNKKQKQATKDGRAKLHAKSIDSEL